jgi:uncharacterized protein
MKFFIIHGAYGNSKENWFPWLKEKLLSQGHEVFVPNLPTPEGQSLENWTRAFELLMKKIDEETIFVGHSLAPAFILSVLEKINIKIKACYFVAGFTGLLNDDLDIINQTITNREFDWDKIKQNCEKFVCYQSTNDPYISIEKGKELADKLDAEFIIVKNAGHFNKKSGFTQFQTLFNKISQNL